MTRLSRCVVAVPAVGCLLLTGCTSMHEYRDPGDACNSYREPLIRAQEEADETFTTGTAISVGLGVAAGVACALAGANPSTCAGVGAGVAALGTGVSYWLKKQQEAQTTAQMQEAIDGLANEKRPTVSPLGAAIDGLNQCRMQSIARLQDSFLARQIDKTSAASSLNVVDAAIAKDQELINKLLGVIDTRATQLAQQKAATLGISLDEYVMQQDASPMEPPAAVAMPEVTPKAAPSRPASIRTASVKTPRLQAKALPPRPKTADPTADLYYDAKAVTLLQKQQAQELAEASSSVRNMLEITGAQLPLDLRLSAKAPGAGWYVVPEASL